MERTLACMVKHAASDLDQMVLAHHPTDTQTIMDGGSEIHMVKCIGSVAFVPIAPAFFKHLKRCIKAFKPDIVHLHIPNASAFLILLLPSMRHIPWVIQWQAEVPKQAKHPCIRLLYPVYRLLENALLKRAKRIITTSQTYLNSSHTLKAFTHKCMTIPLGIESTPQHESTETHRRNSELRLLTVGRLSYYKGMDVLIRALADAPEATLTIVGDGDQREALLKLTETLNLGDRVRFLGRVDDGALLAEYAKCDVFCLPSIERSEAFGLVLLEAMREGKPVLASNLPGSGMIEVVEDGVTGELIEPGNPAAWTKAIVAMSSQPEQRAQMGVASRTRFETHYTADTMRQRLADLYRELCDKG